MADLQPTQIVGTGIINSLVTENIKTSSHTLSLNDRDRVVAMNNTSGETVTVPNDSVVNFPIGSIVYINRINSGSVTLAAGNGVTLRGLLSSQLSSLQELGLRKRAANDWIALIVV